MAAPSGSNAGGTGTGTSGGIGGCGGGTPAALAAGTTLRHLLAVDEDDFDCTIELVLTTEKAGEDAEERPAKRAKHAAAITCRTSSVALKQHSEVFRRWIKGWVGGQEQGMTLRIECEDAEELAAFERLLSYVHSAGRVLPTEPVNMLPLLAVARKYGVDSCVEACLRVLLAQADHLSAQVCLHVLLLLETGVSASEELQAQAEQLMHRAGDRLGTLVAQDAAAMVADEELQAELACYFGHLHSMLSCEIRRKLWLALPFELLSAMFEDRYVQADTEATVLAAFVLWANENVTAAPLAPEDRQRIAAVCSRIRFPDVPAAVLIDHWSKCNWLKQFDGNRDLLLRALVTATDAGQRELWQSRLAVQAGEAGGAGLRSSCRLWWTPRATPQESSAAAASLPAQVDQLPAQACVQLLLLLETGAPRNDEAEAQAGQLMQLAGDRLTALLKEGTATDAALQEDLAAFFGRWHDMLSCPMRRKVWLALPFGLLSAMFEDRRVQADTEATVLAAFALWAESAYGAGPLADADRQRIAAVCSRIRFPSIPVDVLMNYYLVFGWLRHYDGSKDLLCRALATTVDVQQRVFWQSSLSDVIRYSSNGSCAGDVAARKAVQAECLLWWKPRVPPLVCDTEQVTFELQASLVQEDIARSHAVFVRGYWWHVELQRRGDGIGFFAAQGCKPETVACSTAMRRSLYRTRESYDLKLYLDGGEARVSATCVFVPARLSGNGRTHAKNSRGERITWERFWAADSPHLRGGRAQVQLTLGLPPRP